MATAYIGLGSNLGDGLANLQAAWKRLADHPRICCRRLSSPYLTSPLGMDSPQWFTNGVGEVETGLAAPGLLEALLVVEKEMGRDRTASRNRSIDLDLLFYDQLIQHLPWCRIPHPEISGRRFVLVPLEEIAPGFRHPETGATPRQMLAALGGTDQQIVKAAWPGTAS